MRGAAPISPNYCPVCREQFTCYFEQNRQTTNAAAAAAGKKSSKGVREEKVRSSIMKSTADRYKLLFRIECVLRGIVADEQLLPMLVELHQSLIELTLRKHPSIVFVPWTVRILSTHYNIDNGHIFDPIRQLMRDLARVNKAIDAVDSRYLVPDPDNPAQRILDYRALDRLDKLTKRKEGILVKLQELHSAKDENLTDSIFTLVSELTRRSRDSLQASQMTSNPRMAAGALAVGGDMMRSVTAQGGAVGTAEDFYMLSAF